MYTCGLCGKIVRTISGLKIHQITCLRKKKSVSGKFLCEYGCEQESNFQLKGGKWCCCKSSNQCPSFRKKNSLAQNQSTNPNARRWKNGDTPFLGKTPWNKGLTKETNKKILSASEKIRQLYKLDLEHLLAGFIAITQKKNF